MKSGAEQFKDWMHRRFGHDSPQRDTAILFGWDRTFVSALIRGRRIPGLVNAIKIERETGIPVEAWAASELEEARASDGPTRGNRK